MTHAFEEGLGDEVDREANGFLSGLAIGVVTDNEDPEGLARVRVRLTQHAAGDSSFWAHLAVPMSGREFGTYFLPDVDDVVIVGFVQGDPSHPYVLGMLWSRNMPPPTTNSDGNNNERLIRSRSGHELRFVDDPAAPEIELKLQDGKHLVLDKDGVVLEDGSGNTLRIESSSGAISITASSRLSVEAPSVSIEARGSMDIKATGTLTLRGAMVQIN